jgi:copper chaperone CopZ
MAYCTVLTVAGMHAVHAVRAVQTALGGLPGVLSAETERGTVRVEHDATVDGEALRAAVQAAGFEVTRLAEDRRRRLPTLD